MKFIPLILLLLFLISCQNETESVSRVEPTGTLSMESNLVIGQIDQPFENQFGQPIAVRTDPEHNIYVADRGSMTIKVFDKDGNYLRSLGGRGRGPAEFQEMELMEWTPDGNLVILDRGNLLYKVISPEGEIVESFQYNMSNQFFPSAISYLEGSILVLFLDANPLSEKSRENRDLFHIYSSDFQNKKHSLFPYIKLQIEVGYPWIEMMIAPGSFVLTGDHNNFFYSPGIYTGFLYSFIKNEEDYWEYAYRIEGIKPDVDPYVIYLTEEEYQASRLLPGALIIYSGGVANMGRVQSINMGIFKNESNQIIQFFGVRRENIEFTEELGFHLLDIYAQFFDSNGNLIKYDLLTTIHERQFSRLKSFVNWKDDMDNYYLIEYIEDVPVIRRFTLQFE